MRMSMTIGAVAALAITGVADAAIIFYTDEALFNQALADAGKISKWIEDFEQALLPPPPGNFAILNDPLNINNLQGFFNSGDFIDNLTFQSNTNGTDGSNDPGVNGPNPRGAGALTLVGPGLAGAVNAGLLTSIGIDSLDIISGPPAGDNHTALAMHVFGLPASSVQVRVFDKNELEIGLISMAAPVGGKFLGVLATGGDSIGRVNIWEISGNGFEGVYDVQTFLIPAPSALALLGLAGLFGPRRRRHR